MQKIIACDIIKLDEVDSTNSYANHLVKNKKAFDGTVIITDKQTGGRGQSKNSWISKFGDNLTFSIILYPEFLYTDNIFSLNQIVSLGIYDYLSTIIEKEVSIKWPNDIYVGDKKIAGILIENIISNKTILNCVAGIGLNVNQDRFPEDIPNPTSIHIEIGRKLKLKNCFDDLCDKIENRYLELKSERFDKIKLDYMNSLLRYNKMADYKDCDWKFRAKIVDISSFGQLILEKEGGEKTSYDFKEVEFIF